MEDRKRLRSEYKEKLYIPQIYGINLEFEKIILKKFCWMVSFIYYL